MGKNWFDPYGTLFHRKSSSILTTLLQFIYYRKIYQHFWGTSFPTSNVIQLFGSFLAFILFLKYFHLTFKFWMHIYDRYVNKSHHSTSSTNYCPIKIEIAPGPKGEILEMMLYGKIRINLILFSWEIAELIVQTFYFINIST